ncbi:MAG TPA: malonate decarboxylase holo-ACP synthase [Steroidobacteraceae bacterium]|nr:malonate decarboxylase holo-ACP synthase [Steroidobacteraceae bacterium]
MLTEPATHTLLRISGSHVFRAAPEWVAPSLQRAPWVVVRRAYVRDGLVPVGVRGDTRDKRFASWLSPNDILEQLTPQDLVASRAWSHASRRDAIPALAALDVVAGIMRERGFERAWGPIGSVGFELASGCTTATLDSDLDIIVAMEWLPALEDARRLREALALLPVNADVLLETSGGGGGAVVLAEYVRSPEAYVVRTKAGPILFSDGGSK